MRDAEVAIELRRARLKAGLTQAQLAQRMATSQPAVARAESGLSLPTLDFLERFVRETGTTLRLGSLVLSPGGTAKGSVKERRSRVRRATGNYKFNPWLRRPTRSERKSLEADGLTRDKFERTSPTAPRSR